MFKRNTKLCDLDDISKRAFIRKAKKHKVKYKTQIGFSKQMKFGIEVEMLAEDFDNFIKVRRKFDLNWEHLFGERWRFEMDENKWTLGYDESLPRGGRELKSPILRDCSTDWKRLKSMMDSVKLLAEGARIDENCAFQVHFDAGVFNQNPELLFSFMVLLSETEPVLTRFFNGEYINLRQDADGWAKPFTELFQEGLSLDEYTYFTLLSHLYSYENQYKHYAFDFSRLYKNELSDYKWNPNTIENRVPNGTLEPTVIQNNIMLTGFLIEYALSGAYDYEKGFYRIKKFDRNVSSIDDDMAFYVADMLPNDKCKLDFLAQYYKDGSVTTDRQLVKSPKFFK